jgi:hypothetical protein
MISLYTAFLLISIAPIILESTLPPTSTGGGMKDRAPLSIAYAVFHAYFVHPAITIAAVCALGTQVRELNNSSEIGALSINGLLLQAGTFTLVAVGWALRLRLPLDQQPVYNWYPLVGWASVDSFIFAVVQGTLWWRVRRQFSLPRQVVQGDETAPLLSSET